MAPVRTGIRLRDTDRSVVDLDSMEQAAAELSDSAREVMIASRELIVTTQAYEAAYLAKEESIKRLKRARDRVAAANHGITEVERGQVHQPFKSLPLPEVHKAFEGR